MNLESRRDGTTPPSSAPWSGGARVSLVAVALLVGVGAVWMLRPQDPEPRRPVMTTSRKPVEVPAVVVPPVDLGEVREVVAQIPVTSATALPSREEIRNLLRKAAQARAAGDSTTFRECMIRLLSYGTPIQKTLADLLLEEKNADVRDVTMMVLVEVADAEISPFALSMAKAERSASIRLQLLGLLVKFKYAAAAPYMSSLLFDPAEMAAVREMAVEYFGAVNDEETLVRALREVEMLRERIAQKLAAIGTESASRALYDLWRETYDASDTMRNYALLDALSRFRPEVIGLLLDEGLSRLKDPSQRNALLSLLARADRRFALRRIREILATSREVSLRRQAIHIAAALGGVEGQEILLDVVADPSATTDEVLAAANGLMRQSRLEGDFSKVYSRYQSEENPVLRSVYASFLVTDTARLQSDPSMASSLLQEARKSLESGDKVQRSLNFKVVATLAKYTEDPQACLSGLYEEMSSSERDAYPVVLYELGKYATDEEARDVLMESLKASDASVPRQIVAGEALLDSGEKESVYAVLQNPATNGEVVAMLSGMAIAKGGEQAVKELENLATRMPSGSLNRRIVEQKVAIYQERND